ncbi:MAG: chemotaxis response regulator protein-glutamate methylesterase [Acidobacteria bacterium]|nr:chemotaxis response regulator protein-glutamate methylesterase [Acidobacteriota bacterium]
MLPVQTPTTDASPKIRVLVVDDSVVIRRILVDALASEPLVEVVGTAANGALAIERVKALRPDLVTLDIEMPEMDGISALREIKKLNRRIRVIMCSTLTERGAAVTMDALAAGADDYITKSSNNYGDAGLAGLKAPLLAKVRQFFPESARPAKVAGGVKEAAPRVAAAPRAVQKRPQAIVIGVSTGGPNALATVIPALPADLRLPVLIVQHMPPMFTRLLAERLNGASKLNVVEAAEGMTVERGTVYIAPGDFHMTVQREAGRVAIKLNKDPMENSCRPAVDVLFRSAASVYDGATVAVILTGMGQDGHKGVRQLRSMGATVIAQDEATSVAWGMPGYVVRDGLADHVCALNAVAPEIARQASR